MGKRYYCDYCDRSFVDDIQARKKHLQGSSHVRNVKQHYQKHRDLKTFIEEEVKKEECYKFLNSSYCAFGDNCYRSHFSRYQLHMFRNQLEEEKKYRAVCHIAEIKTVESWLQKRNSGILAFEDTSENQSGSLAPYIAFHSNYYSCMPPSLQSIRILRPADINLAEWG